MTDTIKEARALVARITSDDEATRLLAALADECERLRAENARLREAMPTDEERYELGMALDSARPAFLVVFPWLARLDAAKGVR
jgi:hypothetical protein